MFIENIGGALRSGKPHDLRARVIVVSQLAGHALDLHVVQPVRVQDPACDIGGGQSAPVAHLLEPTEGHLYVDLCPEGKDHGGNQNENRPVTPEKTE